MKSNVGFRDACQAQLITNPELIRSFLLKGRWSFDHIRDGKIIHRESWENLITNAGLDHILDVVLSAGSQLTTWYVGLISATPTVAAGDTMSSHAGWTEVTTYSNANRVTWTDAGVSAQSITNSASPASFNINGTVTVGGAFLTSNNTKGGTTGTLLSAKAFSGGNRSFISGDELRVTATYNAANG